MHCGEYCCREKEKLTMKTNKSDFADIEKLLGKLADVPDREPQAQAQGRTHFLSQVHVMAVSQNEEVRHTGCNKNFFERILNTMKLKTKLSALAVLAVIAVVTVFVAGNVTNVSAQKIIARATAAQTLPTHGIWHTQIKIYQNHTMLTGDHSGTTTIDDDYYDLTDGKFRSVSQDSAGKILQVAAFDGTYNYSGLQSAGNGANEPLQVERVKAGPDDGIKARSTDSTATAQAGPADPTSLTKTLFDDFRNNPRVRVDSQKTWTDGTPVYVLIDDNFQTQQGSDDKTLTGSMSMVFNSETYALIESQTTVRKGDQDVVIDEIQWLVNEALPVESSVVWDLSDLKGISIADGEQQSTEDNVVFETLTEQQLAAHTLDYYLLDPLPAGYTVKIGAVANQPKDQDYTFEINYTGPDSETFEMQAVGKMDSGFIESSFYDGSYKAASGLMLNYSPSHSNGTAAMLTAPDGNSFLLFSSLPRDQVQKLVDTLVKGK
jgi:hypothetical protein